MAIYTEVDAPRLDAFLADYDVGALKTHTGIADGVENTTYLVETDDKGRTRRFILTLFERQHHDDLPYFIKVMRHLAASELPCSEPLADKNGGHLKTLCRRPALLTVFLPGKTLTEVNDRQRREVGKHLAALHVALSDLEHHRLGDRGLDWCAAQAAELHPLLEPAHAKLLRSEIEHQTACALGDVPGLPGGAIHTDLFRDNVLFEGDTLTGIIDFYYACDGVFIYDLAVVVNDWARKADHTLDRDRARIILKAYSQKRTLLPSELERLGDALRLAALRFWVSRLTDAHFPRDGHTTHIKDPEVFRRLLEYHREEPLHP